MPGSAPARRHRTGEADEPPAKHLVEPGHSLPLEEGLEEGQSFKERLLRRAGVEESYAARCFAKRMSRPLRGAQPIKDALISRVPRCCGGGQASQDVPESFRLRSMGDRLSIGKLTRTQ